MLFFGQNTSSHLSLQEDEHAEIHATSYGKESGDFIVQTHSFRTRFVTLTTLMTNLHQQIASCNAFPHVFTSKVCGSQTSWKTGFGKSGRGTLELYLKFVTTSHKSTTMSSYSACILLPILNAYDYILRHKSFFNIGSEIRISQCRNFTNWNNK